MQPGISRDPKAWLQVFIDTVQALSLLGAVSLFGYGHLVGLAGGRKWLIMVLVVVLLLLACWRRGGVGGWLTMMLGVWAFLEVRAVCDDLGMPVHTTDLREIERLLFFGAVPTKALQDAFFLPDKLRALDYLAVAIHWSYFFAAYLALFFVWLLKPRSVDRPARLFSLTFLAGLVIYALLPATPPWLASLEPGAPQVYRIVRFVGTSLDAQTYERVYASIGDPNPIAALPSVHFAITFMLFLYSLRGPRPLRTLAGIYCIGMAWALVYLGEHYVVDLLLGGLVAWAVWFGYRKLEAQPTVGSGQVGPSGGF